MITEPLPYTLDVRKAAVRGVEVSGVLRPPKLRYYRELLADDAGSIRAVLAFSRDEENRYLIHIVTDAEGLVICQRCLEPMPMQLHTDNLLAVVWNNEQASHLPRHLDPLIVAEDEDCSLWRLVEEELMLGLPQFNYHNTQDCKQRLARFTQPQPEEGQRERKPNPFNVLENLKPGKRS
ncbi:MAG: hypothetical protein HOC23_02515 [Halieaceae bacterium]|jgi:uncharacterized protein|nr:hypothetical protein [Halieaceae bacterium]